MAKIVCIGKYPPLEGGIAARTYWLTKALGERGHEVHIVTDDVDVEPEYSAPGADRPKPSANVHVHRPGVAIPWHIPDDRHRTLGLLDCAIRVIKEVHPDVIDTGYLVPYGIAGYLAAQATGVPCVLRHGGSDLAKFLEKGVWPELFRRTFAAAALAITDHAHEEEIRRLSTTVTVIPPYVPDPEVFSPRERRTGGRPVLAVAGKANFHWRHKGWHRVAAILRALGTGFEFLVVSQGRGLSDFRTFAEEADIPGHIRWEPFVPPSRMPDLMKTIDGIFVFDGDLPFPSFSNLVLEALYAGATVIADGSYQGRLHKGEGLEIEDLPGIILPVPANDPHRAAARIKGHFDNRRVSRSLPSASVNDYWRYIGANEEVLSSLTG